jgi:hypothetical protein
MTPRLKTLESCAYAAGRAFAYEEADFEQRYVAPVRPGKIMAIALALGGSLLALMHQFGAFSAWRSAA